MKHTPKYEHDCDNCKFLGHVIIDDRDADIYICKTNQERRDGGSLIWRHSSELSDYGSAPIGYTTLLSVFSVAALALYIKYLDANGANDYGGCYFKDGKLILDTRRT